MPNNRQWALIFWAAVLFAWMVYRRDLRSGLKGILQSILTPKVLVPLLILILWVSGLVYVGARTGLWTRSRITDTGLWFITAGVVLFGNFERVSEEGRFFRRRALATLEISTFIEVASEFFVMSLVLEILLQPFLVLLGAMSGISSLDPERRPVKKLADALIVVAGLWFLVYATVSLLGNWGTTDKGDLLRELALPVWLTVGSLPYVYAVGLWASYELAFLRIDRKSEANRWARTRTKLVLLVSFHVKARELGAFSGLWQLKLASATSFREGRRVVRDFREAQRDADRLSEFVAP